MATINGVDSLIIKSIKDKTKKQVIIGTKGLKITGDKSDEDREKQPAKYSLPDLEEMLEKANQLLHREGASLYFQLGEKDGIIRVLIIEKPSQRIIAELSPARLAELLGKLHNYKGFAIDTEI